MGTALAERGADRILRRDRYYAVLRFAARRKDNLQTKERLSARCGSLLRRLIALHGL
jgi:hypothetical protein